MRIPIPHYLLLAETQTGEDTEGMSEWDGTGQWRFVLEATDGSSVLVAEEEEAAVDAERLELLAVVRGLEALDQPSRVTLVTSSRYVSHGLRTGLAEWRENEWQWERFGEMTPVKNGDLWQRVDQALRFHSVDCRTWRVDRPHGDAATGPRCVRGPTLAWETTESSAGNESSAGSDDSGEPRLPPPSLRIFRARRRPVSAWRRWSLSVQWWWRRLSWHGALPAA
ncbi:MAG: RNase H family protein [Pirellulales bacterium]